MISTEASIILIASIIVAGVVGTTIIGIGERVSTSLNSLGNEISEDIRQDIEIVSDVGSGQIYDDTDNKITIQVQNTGSTTIDTDRVLLQVNGKILNISSITTIGDSKWGENDIVVIEADATLSGETRVTVRTERSEDTINFFAE